MSDPIFVGAPAKVLVIVHALAAIVLVGATTHQFLITLGALRGRPKPRLARVYADVIVVTYGLVTLLGALAYPVFRVVVRGYHLDAAAPWASNLFDVKEDFAALGLPLVVAAWLLVRATERARRAGGASPGEDPRRPLPAYVIAVFGTALIVWFDVVSGLVITLMRGV